MPSRPRLRRAPRGPEEQAELSRRRFARRQWARRWLAWKYVAAGVLALVAAVVLLWAVYFSSLLTVTDVTVEGTEVLGVAEVRRAADVPMGDPLARVDVDRVRSRIEALAAVKSVEVAREWPHGLLISVEERVAVAVVDIGGQIRGMDESGVVFRDYAAAPDDLPRVQTTAGTRTDALAEAAQVIRALPSDLAAQVDHVEVETIDQIQLVLRDGRRVVWGSADQSEQKAQVIEVLLERPARTYDVTVPAQPTTSG